MFRHYLMSSSQSRRLNLLVKLLMTGPMAIEAAQGVFPISILTTRPSC